MNCNCYNNNNNGVLFTGSSKGSVVNTTCYDNSDGICCADQATISIDKCICYNNRYCI